jgi:hypothetical protein
MNASQQAQLNLASGENRGIKGREKIFLSLNIILGSKDENMQKNPKCTGKDTYNPIYQEW